LGLSTKLIGSVADLGSGVFLPLDPGSRFGIRDGKKWKSGIRISDHISECLVKLFGLKILIFFVNSVLRIGIQDMAWKNTDLGSGINIPDLHHRKKYTVKVLEHEPEMERNKRKIF
jgi:hypothetical protein